jgi:hypothetical protein
MRAVPLAVTVLLLAAAGARADDESTNEALLKEIRALRESVDALALQMEQLAAIIEGQGLAGPGKAGAADDDGGLPLPPGIPGFVERGPDLAALRKAKLPENPTKEQAREYVASILRISERPNIFSTTDPQGVLLARVAPEHLDVLIDALDRDRSGDMYLVAAINMLAGEEHKQMILDALPYAPDLAQVVVRYGWAADARETLLAGLDRRTDYLPDEWLDALVSLDDPTTYEALVNYFIWGRNRSMTYEAIQYLPGIDLDKAVAEAWEAARWRDDWEAQSLAPIAMEHGVADALRFAVNRLGADEGHWDNEMLRAVLRYTDARGTADDIRRWYRENADELVWDAKAHIFRVPKAE